MSSHNRIACFLSLLTAALINLSSASSLQPGILPLIVRNPYLSTWLPNAREAPWSRWPTFWIGQELGFGIMAYVPSTKTIYPLLGRPHDSLSSDDSHYDIAMPTYLGATFDASTTNLSYHISHPSHDSPLEIVLSFLSPITPTSTLRQSIPASYIEVIVSGGFDVSIHLDVNGQWMSGDRNADIEWSFDEHDGLKTWSVKRQQELLFTEKWDRAEWGTLRLVAPHDASHECGTSAKLRHNFARNGSLANSDEDRHYRAIQDHEPVFAFAKHFGLSSSNSEVDSTLFTLLYIRDPVVQFAAARGVTNMRPLWKSWFATDDALTHSHYHDYHKTWHLAKEYSEQLALDAYESGSDAYVDIVALSARQTLGATDFAGTAEQPLLFLKEISSDGNCQTIDVIFPAFPFFLYTNPQWLAYMLEPLIEHMLSGQYPNKYAMHDLGSSYPNVTGHPDGRDEYMPVEECGDILIMGLALVQSLKYSNHTLDRPLGDSNYSMTALNLANPSTYLDQPWVGGEQGIDAAREWVNRSYPLWKQWTGYLVEYTLEPHNQLSTDDFAGWLALQTNLALKGIIGIKAMSELAALVGEDEDAKNFRNNSDTYIKRWQELGISRDKTHFKLAYDWWGSWTTIYSLYADALLCFHPSVEDDSPDKGRHDNIAAAEGKDQKPLVRASDDNTNKNFIPTRIYQMQSQWYHNVMQKYGLPLDSRHLYSKSDWAFEAAAVASRSTRKEILDAYSRWVNETVINDRPLTDLYKTEGDGGFPGPNFFARPVVGGHFAFLALERRACAGHALDGLRELI